MITPLTLEEIQAAWEARLEYLRIKPQGGVRSASEVHSGMKQWLRVVNRMPNVKGKLTWVEPAQSGHVSSHKQDCVVLGVIYLEYHP